MPNTWPTGTGIEGEFDVLGEGAETGGPGTSGQDGTKFYNINDPAWGFNAQKVDATKPTKFWESDKLSLGDLPPLIVEPKTCQDKCDEAEKLTRKKCEILRKRVQEALKHAGCPSKVTGYPKKPRCPRAVASKKKPAAKARRRR